MFEVKIIPPLKQRFKLFPPLPIACPLMSLASHANPSKLFPFNTMPYPGPFKLIHPSQPSPYESARAHPCKLLPESFALHAPEGQPAKSLELNEIQLILSLHA